MKKRELDLDVDADAARAAMNRLSDLATMGLLTTPPTGPVAKAERSAVARKAEDARKLKLRRKKAKAVRIARRKNR